MKINLLFSFVVLFLLFYFTDGVQTNVDIRLGENRVQYELWYEIEKCVVIS